MELLPLVDECEDLRGKVEATEAEKRRQLAAAEEAKRAEEARAAEALAYAKISAERDARNALATLEGQLKSQMVYSRGGSGGGRFGGQTTGVSDHAWAHISGLAGTPAGAAKISMTEELTTKLSITSLYKGLRYGAVLVPRWPLQLTFIHGSGVMCLTGSYWMEK